MRAAGLLSRPRYKSGPFAINILETRENRNTSFSQSFRLHNSAATMAEESKVVDMTEKPMGRVDVDVGEAATIPSGAAHLQRKLGGKEVQLFALGGAIGTSTPTHLAPFTTTVWK